MSHSGKPVRRDAEEEAQHRTNCELLNLESSVVLLESSLELRNDSSSKRKNGDENDTAVEDLEFLKRRNWNLHKRLDVSKPGKKRKLLVLDVNGFLVSTFRSSDKTRPEGIEHKRIAKKLVYRRPFCSSFLEFCLENFHVGVWSSLKEKNVIKTVDFTFGEMKEKLEFIWHQSMCTTTQLMHPEECHRPLFLKELSRLWAEFSPGDFNSSNTLLVDDSPYKALRNPPYTAIFPNTYTHDSDDNFLVGPLRRFLEGLLDTDNVQDFVKENPIGVPPLSASSPNWKHYCQILTVEAPPLHANKLTMSETCGDCGIVSSVAIFTDSEADTTSNGNRSSVHHDSASKHVPKSHNSLLGSGPASEKLLVLDINGLLVSTYDFSDGTQPQEVEHAVIGRKCIYKRPSCDDFLKFCFQNFHVGVWSSANQRNVQQAVNFVFKNMKPMLEFIWHQADCSNTGIDHPEIVGKPVFLKELSKLWNRFGGGKFNASNTLLIDDTPYKAIRNPPFTAIFPHPYTHDFNDDFLLGPLRKFLEGIRDASDVQEYVKRNPIGASPIMESSAGWVLYKHLMLKEKKKKKKKKKSKLESTNLLLSS
jgi:hypothetical protein